MNPTIPRPPHHRLHDICLVGVLLAAAALLTGCADGRENARAGALRFLAEQVEAPEPSWSYLLPYLSRSYGVEIRLASGQRFGAAGDGDADALTVPRVYRRLLDPGATVVWDDIAALESPVDRILAAALHCDRLGLPEGWLDTLRAAGDHGGYALTHAVLAAGWTRENGCLSPIDLGPLRAVQLEQLEALVDGRDALASGNPNASDIWIEALALFGYAGASGRVKSEWLEALQALQGRDGGWPEHPKAERSSAHTTAFALWALLDAMAADRTSRSMIPR